MLLFCLIAGSVLLISFFAGSEVAFETSSRFRMEVDISQKGISSGILKFFNEHASIFRVSLITGYHLSMLGFATGIVILVFSTQDMYPAVFVLMAILSFFISSLFITLIAGLLTHNLILLNPNNILRTLGIPLFVFFLLFFPFTGLYYLVGKLTRRLFLKEDNIPLSAILTKAAMDKWLFQHSQTEEDQKEDQEIKMFQKALGFSKVRIRDCMIPRTEIEAIDINAGVDELRRKFINTGFSKIIVYRNSADNIVGYVNSKELFKHPVSIREKITEISFVPETMPASKMLHEFMQYHRSIAVVVDEYGGISGIVTLEDIMEEIFGEIEDEHDTDHWVEKVINSNEFIFSGRLEIEYLNSEYHLNIPEIEEYDTLAGFILFHHHTLPKRNENIIIEQFSFRILKVSNTRIDLVHLKVLEI